MKDVLALMVFGFVLVAMLAVSVCYQAHLVSDVAESAKAAIENPITLDDLTDVTETKTCVCGKQMILRYTGDALMSYPAQMVREWWCACGKTEKAEPEVLPRPEDLRMTEWKRANGITE